MSYWTIVYCKRTPTAVNIIVNGARVCSIPSHAYSTTSVEPPALAQLKRGTGGRSSFNGLVASVFGASGFLGRSVMSHLGRTGTQIIVPYRGDPYYQRDLKVVGDLGQVLFQPFHLDDEESIRKAIQHSNVVINLIGKEIETRCFTHHHVHVEGAARLARLSREMGVERFIHVSALVADPNPKTYVKRTPSTFMRSKALGEIEVRRERPDAVIFRPADIWGHGDRFLYYYACRFRRYRDGGIQRFPLWRLGEETVKQPVYVNDLAKGIVAAVGDQHAPGHTYDAVGPHRYRLDDLIKWMMFTCRYFPHEVKIMEIGPLFKMKTRVNEMFAWVSPFLHMERLERECPTDILSGGHTLLDLGVELTKMEDHMHHMMYFHRRMNMYWDALGEFPAPPNPPLSLV